VLHFVGVDRFINIASLGKLTSTFVKRGYPGALIQPTPAVIGPVSAPNRPDSVGFAESLLLCLKDKNNSKTT